MKDNPSAFAKPFWIIGGLFVFLVVAVMHAYGRLDDRLRREGL